MTVRAKFTVTGFKSSLHQRPAINPETGKRDDWKQSETVEMRTVELSPVYADNDPEHENSKFWDASPSGKIELGTVNPEAWGRFELGKEYYVDFTPAD